VVEHSYRVSKRRERIRGGLEMSSFPSVRLLIGNLIGHSNKKKREEEI
jgi:hypothetical protein